ncbi:MAG TPA: molybdate ABC transporter substrate-binding protein [Methyloceanibacter sp.]
MKIATRREILRALVAVMAIGVVVVPFQTHAEDSPAADKGPLVFAAASLKDALDAISAEWQRESGKQATISYAASSALAKQIEKGAPADIFVSADEDWMNYLAERKLIKPDTRFDLAGNRLVLIAPTDSKLTATIGQDFPLASLLGDGRLAMADTASVPAGKYGKAALEKLGAWDGVKDKIAQAENVRAALSLVSRGEAPLGIVYATDAKADPKVKVLDTFPESTHAPILYPIAITASSTNANAPAFLAYLKTADAQSVFEAQGFKVLLNY